MIRRPPRSTQSRSSAASDVYKRQGGTVRDCSASKSDSGIDVSDKSTVTLESNSCNSNRLAGISVYGSARPLVRGNACLKNGDIGIYSYGKARPKVESNTCSGGKYGVYI